MKNKEELQKYFFNNFVCGCGNPEEIAKLIRNILQLRKLKHDQYWEEKDREKQKLIIEEEINLTKELFKDADVFELLVLYLLDNKGLTEHGGSVYTSHLTEEGRDLLDSLNNVDLEALFDY